MTDRLFDYEVVVSALHDRAHISDLSANIDARLGSIGGVGESGSDLAVQPLAIVVGTGGSEQRVIARWRSRQVAMPGEPALMVAHETDNSLPAALEALAAIRQRGGSGRIVMLERLGDVAAAVHAQAAYLSLQRYRLGVVGEASEWLVASSQGADVVKNQWGPTLVPMEVPVVSSARMTVTAVQLGRRWTRYDTAGNVDPREVDRAASVHGPLVELMANRNVDGISVRCFDLLSRSNTSGCIALAELNASGIIAGCEGDVPSALAMIWVKELLGATAWMANPASVDPETGRIELAHCTVAPNLVEGLSLDTHFESGLGIGISGRFRPQPVTLVRIGGAMLDQIWLADGELVSSGSSSHLCRTQASVMVDRGRARDLLERPLGNHVVMIGGHHREQLRRWWDVYIDRCGDQSRISTDTITSNSAH